MLQMRDWLFRCPFPDPDTARRWRLTNTLLLGFIALLAFSTIFVIRADERPQQVVGLLLFAGLFVLNRRGALLLASAGLIVLAVLVIAFVSLNPHYSFLAKLTTPISFVIPIALSGALFTWWVVPAVVAGAGLLTSWIYLVVIPQALPAEAAAMPTSSPLGTALSIFVAIGLLTASYSRYIHQTLRDLQERNGALAAVNTDLAAQYAREQSLGTSISTLAKRLAAVSQRQGTSIAVQAQSISHVVSTVAELHGAATQIAGVAAEVRQVADAAYQAVQRAQAMVLRSREAVARNRDQVEQVIDHMTALDQLTARITGFVNRIHDLSDETQLLALNATIEAAGAGHVGRRFSVVAAEVQALSDRANGVVEQIRMVIADLRQAGQVGLAATQSSIAVASEVELLADEVRQAQEQVVHAMERTTDLLHMISTATDQQTRATEQMTHTMQQIAFVADTTRQDTSALEQVTGELADAAGLLTHTLAHPTPALSTT